MSLEAILIYLMLWGVFLHIIIQKENDLFYFLIYFILFYFFIFIFFSFFIFFIYFYFSFFIFIFYFLFYVIIKKTNHFLFLLYICILANYALEMKQKTPQTTDNENKEQTRV